MSENNDTIIETTSTNSNSGNEYGATQRNSKRMRPNDPIGNLSRSMKCDSTLFPALYNTPISVQPTNSLSQAFKILIDNQIVSIPIVDENHKVTSVLSLMNLISILLDNFSDKELKESSIWKGICDTEESNAQIKKLFSRKISEFKFDKAFKVLHTDPISTALSLILENRVHRLVVVDENDEFVNFITESRILEIVSTIVHAVPAANKTLSSLKLEGIALKDVESVKMDDVAINAFKKMRDNWISGVVVVDSLNHAIGNISLNDIKLLGFDLKYFEMLDYSVSEYLEAVLNIKTKSKDNSNKNKNEKDDNKDDDKASSPSPFSPKYKALKSMLSKFNRKVVTCSLDDTLISVISTIKHYHIHRIFVEDDLGHPIGVLSVYDILKALVDLHNHST